MLGDEGWLRTANFSLHVLGYCYDRYTGVLLLFAHPTSTAQLLLPHGNKDSEYHHILSDYVASATSTAPGGPSTPPISIAASGGTGSRIVMRPTLRPSRCDCSRGDSFALGSTVQQNWNAVDPKREVMIPTVLEKAATPQRVGMGQTVWAGEWGFNE